MFDNNDYDKIMNNLNAIPDGIFDATSFYEDLKIISNHLEKTDHNNQEQKIKMMMDIINNYHKIEEDKSYSLDEDKVYSTTVALLFHLSHMFSGMIEESITEYWDNINNDIMPTIQKDSNIMPYWDVE